MVLNRCEFRSHCKQSEFKSGSVKPCVEHFLSEFFGRLKKTSHLLVSISSPFFTRVFCMKVTFWQLFLAKKNFRTKKDAKNDDEIYGWCQFHQRFMRASFVQKSFQKHFSSYIWLFQKYKKTGT
jgi:hypothetical protein